MHFVYVECCDVKIVQVDLDYKSTHEFDFIQCWSFVD